MKCKIRSDVVCYSLVKEYGCQGCSLFNHSHQTLLQPHTKQLIKEVKENLPIKYSPASSGDFSLPLLSTVKIGSELEITEVSFGEGNYGEYAVIATKKQGKLRSGNMVILKQLHDIADIIAEKEDSVIVKLNKVGAYYTF